MLETPLGEPAAAPHKVSLAGGWALWRTAVLRGAGLPAATVLQLAAPALAAAADRLLQLEREAAASRAAAVSAANASLDDLHRGGEPFDRERHTLLLRVIQALKKGKRPGAVPDGPLAAAVARVEAADAELAVRRAELASLYEQAVAQSSAELARIADWDLFREAVLWQNPETVGLALDGILSPETAGSPRSSRRRQREEMIASYLQRYCVKNDTIGFFGPVGWAELVEDGPPVAVEPGPALLAERQVYFESWCVEALAEKLARDLPLRPWLAPRLRRGLALVGAQLHAPGRRAVPLDPLQARLLRSCDGQRTARALAAELIADPAVPVEREEQVFRQLQALADLGALIWTLEVPLELHPERTLRAALGSIEPAELRDKALAALDELEDRARRVARAAGDPAALESAMKELATTFESLTGKAPRRHHGKLYAARGLVYEECRRDVSVRFGPGLLAALEAPLALVLASARWLAGELTRRFAERLTALHAGLQARTGSATVDSAALVREGFATLFKPGQRDRCFVEAQSELQARWAAVLGWSGAPAGAPLCRSTSAIRERCAAAFPSAGPSWGLVRYFSPDLMIAAPGEAAFRDGDFQAVLGEIHPTNTLSWSCFVSQHPNPDELLRMIERDLRGEGGEPLLVPQFPRDRWVQRMNVHLVLPGFLRYELLEQGPVHPPCRALPAGAAVVREVGGALRVESRDGAIRFPAYELFALPLTQECSRILGALLPPAPHRPRVTIDDLVVARESWRFPMRELGFAGLHEPRERFLAARRWAREHGLPRFCFYKVPRERKPCFLDLESPIYVDLFAKLVRGAARAAEEGDVLAVAEMLPTFDQTWLTDAQGQRYTCELRLVAIEQSGGAQPSIQ
jgi:lantibiotic biosynthesis dehydratase-like protein